MINSVSAVSFKANAPVDPISRPGKYTKPDSVDIAPEKKKKGVGRKIFDTTLILATIVAAGVGLAHLAKHGKLDALAGKDNFVGKIGKYLKTAGEWLNANVVDKVVGFFNKVPKNATPAA